MNQVYKLGLTSETPCFVEHAPCEDRRVIEIPVNGGPHHGFESTSAQGGIAPLAEIREIGHDQHSKPVRPVEQKRVIDLDVNAEEVEPHLLREGDILLKSVYVTGRVDPFRVIGLMERPAQVTGSIIQP